MYLVICMYNVVHCAIITFVVQMELLLLQESKRKTAELAKLGQVLERKGE